MICAEVHNISQTHSHCIIKTTGLMGVQHLRHTYKVAAGMPDMVHTHQASSPYDAVLSPEGTNNSLALLQLVVSILT